MMDPEHSRSVPPGSVPLEEREEVLRQAFLSFQSASESLVSSYSALERRIAELSEDLTQTNRALDRQGSFLEAILESLSAGVVVLLPGGVPLYRNPAMDAFGDPHSPAFLSLLSEKGLWPPSKESLREVSVAFDHGGRSWVAVRRPVKGPEGQEIGYVFVFSDATRLKEMEEEVSRDRRLRAMGEMIAQIAHELRSPLGSLELFRSLLEREGGSPQGQEYLGHMATSIASMDRLVGNLLYHTRTPSLEEEEVDGRELVLRLSRDLSRMAASSSRDRTPPDIRALVPDSPLLLSGDGDLLYHALFNLATNALEAVMALPESPKKEEVFRRIRLECAQGLAGEVSFRVSDNGTGIASEIAERIFDPFFTTRAKGTGLGLSIVHNIAVAHGGDVRYAREDGWTVFVLTLPVVRPPGDRFGGVRR